MLDWPPARRRRARKYTTLAFASNDKLAFSEPARFPVTWREIHIHAPCFGAQSKFAGYIWRGTFGERANVSATAKNCAYSSESPKSNNSNFSGGADCWGTARDYCAWQETTPIIPSTAGSDLGASSWGILAIFVANSCGLHLRSSDPEVSEKHK